MPLEIDLWVDDAGFWCQNRAMLATKWDQTSMLTSKGLFYKRTCKTNRIWMIFEVRGVEVGSKNRSKNDVNIESKMECLLASICERFWWIFGAKMEAWASWEEKSIQNRSKNGVNMGIHLGIDFWWILVDFGRQVGRETGAKIDPKRHRKTMQKRRAARLPTKSQ